MSKIKLGDSVYPEVYLSSKLEQISEAEPKIPVAPQKPIAPKLPEEPSNDTTYSGCFFIGSIILIIYIFSVISKNGLDLESIQVLIYSIPMAIFCGALFGYGILHGSEIKDAYLLEKQTYPKRKKEYEEKLKLYEIELRQYNDTVSSLLSKSNVLSFRRTLVNSYLASLSIDLLDIDTSDAIRKGVGEKYFVDYLRNYLEKENPFGNYSILTNKKIEVWNGFYYPDIVYITDNGLYIDIEIDEPYVGATGEPIHYYGLSSDYNRNKFFKDHNWIVVRFAEKQIFENPECCCDLLLLLQRAVSQASFDDIYFPENLLIKKWTLDLSHAWAYRRYRNSYLPAEYAEKIAFEDWNQLSDEDRNYIERSTVYDEFDDLPF